MITRVLLVEPPVTRPADFGAKKVRIGVVPPLGLTYLAAVLEQHGVEVKIVDCLIEGSLDGAPYSENRIRYGLSDEQIKHEIEQYRPDMVGVSCLMSAKVYDMHNICRIAKEIDKDIVTVTGGSHPTMAFHEVLQDENVDFVVLGEGDYTLYELIKALNGEGELEKVDGLAYRQGGRVAVNPKMGFIENLDELPLPARHLLRMEKYLKTASPHSGIKRQPFTSMISSRGCPNRCGFCVIRHLWGGKARLRSAENVLKEIEQLITDYGIKEVHFEDDNFTWNKERTKAILNGIIERGWDISLSSPSGLSVITLDEELLALMKKAGYYSISVAVESGDKDVLRLMRKPVSLDRAKRVIEAARRVGLKTKGFFILGYPGETKEQMQRTVDFAATVGLDWAIFFIATPIPGSDLDKLCRENGYLIDEHLDYVRHFYVSNIRTPEFDPEYVEKLRERANFEINFKGNINIRLGDYDRAIEDIGEVVRLYPHLDFARFYLGVAYEKKGLRDKAIEQFRKVLEINPSYPEVEERVKELEA
jgi:anaerobic magnesium-protoporphyrin IX monomethyl ester cyclase